MLTHCMLHIWNIIEPTILVFLEISAVVHLLIFALWYRVNDARGSVRLVVGKKLWEIVCRWLDRPLIS